MNKSIAETFRNGTALVTGSTGFVGKLLMEKLLRSCPVKCIAVLVRSKKLITVDQRIAEIAKTPLLDQLRSHNPNFVNHIKIINGDILDQSLGLSKSDYDWLIENVNFVFHSAASVKFNEPLEIANKINVQGTNGLLSLASEMKNLKGFVHISTAYSHCNRDEIQEQFYPMTITANELNNRLNEDINYNIIENWPNTYCYSKAIVEDLISTNEHNLPISVFRPSIIGSTKSEPIPGYLENLNGPSGTVSGMVTGYLRAIPLDPLKIADIVPADYTVNALISVMWDTVNRYKTPCPQLFDKKPKIYNYVSSAESPISWGSFNKHLHNNYVDAPPLQGKWYLFFICYTNYWIGVMLKFFLHRIPAAIMDLSLIFRGSNPKVFKMYSKAESMLDVHYTFTTKEWKFDNSNIKKLWSLMSPEDRQTFRYSLEKFDWQTYLKDFYRGVRKHILKEELSNLKIAKSKSRKYDLTFGSTKSEPIPGYLENLNGPSGTVSGMVTGYLRAIPLDPLKIADIVPADYTVNALISVMWDTVNRYKTPCPQLFDKKPKIYNYVSSAESPISWGSFNKNVHNNYEDAPPLQGKWYLFFICYTNYWIGVMLKFFLHRIPAVIMYLSLIFRGSNPKVFKMYSKAESMLDVHYTFTTKEWKFDNSNIKKLWSLMSPEDRQTFRYSLEKFDWQTYLKDFYRGVRKHILKEELSNLKIAKSKSRKLFWLHIKIGALSICFAGNVCWMLIVPIEKTI